MKKHYPSFGVQYPSFGVQYPSFGVHSSLFLAFFAAAIAAAKKCFFSAYIRKDCGIFLRPLSRPQKNDFKRVRAGLRRRTIAKSRTVRFKSFSLHGVYAVYVIKRKGIFQIASYVISQTCSEVVNGARAAGR